MPLITFPPLPPPYVPLSTFPLSLNLVHSLSLFYSFSLSLSLSFIHSLFYFASFILFLPCFLFLPFLLLTLALLLFSFLSSYYYNKGTKWEYGTGIDWVGLILEEVTGQRLEELYKKTIFKPLKIKSSTFFLTKDVAKNHAHLHDRALNDSLSESPSHLPTSDQVDVQLGGLGLHMTAPDVNSILLCLLNDGVGKKGKRILTKESVALLLEDQTTKMGIELPNTLLMPAVPGVSNPGPENLEGVGKSWSFGGVKLVKQSKTGKTAGSVWWAGIPNCYWYTLSSSHSLSFLLFLFFLLPSSPLFLSPPFPLLSFPLSRLPLILFAFSALFIVNCLIINVIGGLTKTREWQEY